MNGYRRRPWLQASTVFGVGTLVHTLGLIGLIVLESAQPNAPMVGLPIMVGLLFPPAWLPAFAIGWAVHTLLRGPIDGPEREAPMPSDGPGSTP